MITDVTQRWRDRRDSYRPAREVVDVSRLDVEEIALDRVACAFVEQHHYSASHPAARFRFGLMVRGELAGVAVFSQPIGNHVYVWALNRSGRRLLPASMPYPKFSTAGAARGLAENAAGSWRLARRAA